jgi:hypothetical protein
MKKYALLFLSMILIITVFANDNKYESSMQSAIEKLYAMSSLEETQKVVAQFERISQAETDKWLPSYYASLGYVWMTHQESDVTRHDQFLDAAQKNLGHCKTLISDNDEVAVLQGYIYMMRITVDPASRGAQYSGMSMGEFQKALAINPGNPRALLMMGQMKYGTDQFFGNDLTDACNMLKGAAQKLENEKPDDKLSPSWGKSMAEHLVQNCQ